MNNQIQKKFMRKAKFISYLLRFMPFIRMIAVTGSVARGEVDSNSDIDLFIITKHGRIWTARFFLVIFLKIIGQYRTGDLPSQKAGKICPNRYVTDGYLIINPQNQYHAQEYSQIIPFYSENQTYQDFIQKNNWIKKYQKFKIYPVKNSSRSIIKNIEELILSGFIGDWLEKSTRKIQLKTILQDSRVNQPNSGLYVDDNELRFHPDPR